LAVDARHQGKGVGQDLLAFALRLAVEFSQRVGLYAVVVDAKHDKAKAFYVKLGFIVCVDNPLCLYLPVATLERAAVV
jgi:GNAT superfamily N-acetyltransferase